MAAVNLSLFEGDRLKLPKAIDLTIENLCEVGELYRHWSISFSGGKDSTTVVTLIVHLIETGQIPKPESLHIIFADTGMELPPLYFSAIELMEQLEQREVHTKVVLPELDHRFFVYMFGRGVPAPIPGFRWCVGLLKVRPMTGHLEEQHQQFRKPFLSLTGVRLGESAARDQRIALSCGKDGTECSQGYLQAQTPINIATIHHPIIHWRVCNVFDWLMFEASAIGFPTAATVAKIYGGDEAVEMNARTGCVGCNVAQKETALNFILTLPEWAYLAPLKRLKPLYREIAQPQYRHRQPGEKPKQTAPWSATKTHWIHTQ
jgi:DNA sulfur modification protein DndC